MKFIIEIPDKEVAPGHTAQDVANDLQQLLKTRALLQNLEVKPEPDWGLDLQKIEYVADRYVGSHEIEIDPLDGWDLSPGEDGIWVHAWVHLDNALLAKHGITNPEARQDNEDEE